ncbi:TPA: rod shape-determining protein, partial [Bacillus anthracis]|nr:rod shape-determining protein [Bacillus anthracis]
IGGAYPREQQVFMDVKGRNLVSGLPVNIKVSSEEILEALEESVATIADAVHSVLEKTPPELASDIANQGIVMTGGGALLWGFNKLIEKRTGIPVYIAEEAVSCVAKGTGSALDS